jgi:hypothetical protein
MRLTRTATALTIAVLTAAVLSACGDGNDTAEARTTSAPEPTSASTEAGPTATPTPAPAGDVEAFCDAYEVLSEIDPAARDPKELQVNVIAFAAATRDAAEAAPPEIQEPARVLAGRFSEYVAMVKAADYRPTKKQVIAFFADPAVAGAGRNLDIYAENHCDS